MKTMASEMFIFARFHAKEGQQHSVGATIQEVLEPTRQEPGCLRIEAFRSSRDERLFYVHSRWKDESAFDRHAQLPHTLKFVDKVQTLIDPQLEVIPPRPIGGLAKCSSIKDAPVLRRRSPPSRNNPPVSRP